MYKMNSEVNMEEVLKVGLPTFNMQAAHFKRNHV